MWDLVNQFDELWHNYAKEQKSISMIVQNSLSTRMITSICFNLSVSGIELYYLLFY